MTKLKPCPFCGEKARLRKDSKGYKEFQLGCFNDYCSIQPQTEWRTFKEDDIFGWNKRDEVSND